MKLHCKLYDKHVQLQQQNKHSRKLPNGHYTVLYQSFQTQQYGKVFWKSCFFFNSLFYQLK